MQRRWTINGRFLSQPMTGVQRYAHEIVCAMDSLVAEQHPLARGLEIEVLVPPKAGELRRRDAIKTRPAGRVGGHAWEQAVLPANLNGGGLLSLCNTGPVMAKKHIVCIHDVNVWNAPQSYALPFKVLYRTLLPALGRTAWSVATVSNYSRKEIARRGIAPYGQTFLAPNGHEHALRWKARHSDATRAVASRNTIVLIGSSVPHKNTGFILGMAERLVAEGFRIAVVGKPDQRVFKSQEPTSQASNANVTWLGRLSDAELAALMQDSLCLAFPSLTEGFGLPALEAMAVGCPAIVTDRASLPEVCGDAALYAAPDDEGAWMGRFMQLRNSPPLRSLMVPKGRARAHCFSWRESALRYLRAMAQADGMDTDLLGATDRVADLVS